MNSSPTIKDVKQYWTDVPVGGISLELGKKYPVGSKEFFDHYHEMVDTDNMPFAIPTWEFDKHPGELVLDIGAGIGWLVKKFAEGKANIVGVDISKSSIFMTKHQMELYGLKAKLVVADAERLPFKTNTFSFVTSDGVLHHTEHTDVAINEAHRVMKQGGGGVISLYYKTILLKPAVFPLTKLVMKILGVTPAGRENMSVAKDSDDFVRQYDGENNPIGRYYSEKECEKLFERYKILGHELHFFPLRFIPIRKLIPRWLHYLLDKYFGLLIFYRLKKSA